MIRSPGRLFLPILRRIGSAPLDLLFLSGDDMRALALSDTDVLDAVEAAVRAQGEGAVTLDPALRQAAHLAEGRPAREPLQRLVKVLGAEVAPVDRDRTLAPDVSRVRTLVASGLIAR